jgi:dipeptidyl aminopeptidase/acylaminoacyl peptidase
MFRALSPAIVLVCLIVSAPALGQGQAFTPQHIAKLRVVTATAVAPDGTQIAYVLSVPRQLPREKDGASWAELHVVDSKGNSTPFVTGAVNVDAVEWTPDGKSISFLAKRDKDEHRTLYIIPAKGGESRKVLHHGADLIGYSWAPDGKQVAFLANEPTAAARKKQQDQGFNQEIYEEDTPSVRVWIGDIDSDQPARMVKLEGSASELHWSPAGDRLAVALAPTPLIDDHLMFRKVHIVDVKSGASATATNLKNPGKMGQLSWSPDGKILALISAADKHDPLQGRLWLKLDGQSGWNDVTPGWAGHVESIAWKDGSTILTQASGDVWTLVGTGRITSDGNNPTEVEHRLLVKPGGPILAGITASKDGKALACVGQTPRHPPEVYFMGEGDKEPRRLTDHNPWLKDMAFAEQAVVKHTARDGLELEGILVKPLNCKPGERYPLVMTVHGGPEAHIANGWVTLYHSLGQVGAARGLAVFYPNYRGSTGRGVTFSMLGQKEAGGPEFDDLVDAVDHLVKTGLVDKAKVGITGGSYGGYATAWGSTYYSDRFAAGVMFVGISDWISCSGTTDIPYEMNLVHHRHWLWDDWTYFAKSSPIHHVEKAKTPLLILHGKSDPRVHPSQSLELYRHLKVRGKAPVRLVLYPGEGHGNRRAASRLDYNVRMLQWFEHYLKGPGGPAPPYEVDYGTDGSAKSVSGRPVRLPRFLEERNPFDETGAHPFCGRRGCPCCVGP